MNAVNTFMSALFSPLTSATISGAVLLGSMMIVNCVWGWFNARESNHTGAGILPYCVKNNEVYFLLSKEGYGSSKNTWCDFGGAKNPGETVIQTAAREGWEESRDLLGDKKAIESKISSAPSIGSKSYKMFFMKIENPAAITNDNFTKRQFYKFCRMEKTEIAWVKADDVFEAIQNHNQISIQWFSFFSKDKLRGFFAKTICDALNNPEERKILQNVCQIITLPLKQAS